MNPSKSMLPDALVSGAWLEAHLAEPSLRVVDIRGYVRTTDLGEGRQRAEYLGAGEEYAAGHVPGAVFVDWTSDIIDPDDSVPAQIAPAERFASAMAARGIGDGTDVVAVDHTGGHFATRLWWALRYYGHERVAVLDGGQQRWTEEGRPLSTEAPAPALAVFTPTPRPELRVEVDEVAASFGEPATLLVDARDREQYQGEVARGSRAGHVPGAVNLPAKSLLTAEGTWRPLPEQRRLLAEAGVRTDRRVIAYCNGGVTATAVLFAMHRTGFGGGANYDGSWNEWGERPDLPLTTGAEAT